MIIHPLHTDIPAPQTLNNPFDYKPHPLCLLAAEEVQRVIRDHEEWREEMARGKMFGVLVVESDGNLGYLAAYSGQINSRSDWEGFVPAVFDYLQPIGYFKREENAISEMNRRIAKMKRDPQLKQLTEAIAAKEKERDEALARQQKMMVAAKMLRDRRRREKFLSENDRQQLVRESQFQKAQLHRMKVMYGEEIDALTMQLANCQTKIEQQEHERKQRSQALQHWLFSRFVMLNSRGESRSLVDIFSESEFKEPPSGAGECCEPKLLQYAFAHGLRPVSMAMFWYGGQTSAEVRHHLQFYPACSGKCKPILQWMLGGFVDLSVPLLADDGRLVPKTIYEDDTLIVVSKPDNLLTIPGVDTRYSVYSIFRQRFPDTDSPLTVHRLDMPTSGLLVLAKTRPAYVELQRQFAAHTVRKRYVAVVEGIPENSEGMVSLPMRPDVVDRPRQLVDFAHGKYAVTKYRVRKTSEGRAWLDLWPQTGRTHQLRVHCAHHDGLGCPIVGDFLYGRAADRLYLHAEYLEFTHPDTGERVHFEDPAPF